MEFQIIEKSTRKLIAALQNIDEKKVKYFSFDLQCDGLEDFNHVDIRQSDTHKTLFAQLSQMTGPVLYWFEITSDIENSEIREAIENYKAKVDCKTAPALKKGYSLSSKCLYVGKVRQKFWGRIIQHLGYYKQRKTQGLQLFYWAKGLGLDITIHAYEFDKDMADLVSILELEFARELEPIIGKH